MNINARLTKLERLAAAPPEERPAKEPIDYDEIQRMLRAFWLAYARPNYETPELRVREAARAEVEMWDTHNKTMDYPRLSPAEMDAQAERLAEWALGLSPDEYVQEMERAGRHRTAGGTTTETR